MAIGRGGDRRRAAIPLDWDEIKRRYGQGATVPTATSGRPLRVTRVDDERIYVETSMWSKSLAPALTDFVEQYGKRVTTERRSLAAHILKDLGYLR